MHNHVLPRLVKDINRYKAEHHGEMPLYILVSSYEADGLLDEIRLADGYQAGILVTDYKGCKIVKHDSLKKGEMRLTNELPESGS